MENQILKPEVTYLKDYRAPDYKIEAVDLRIDLYEGKAIVNSTLQCCRLITQGRHQRPLILKGEKLKLLSILLDKKPISVENMILSSHELKLENLPDFFRLDIITEIYPQKNTELSGLYRSRGLFCTQCEAQGFRRITYYLDRPDVMAPFTTTISADKTHYPVLLSNGNKVDQGILSDNRHWVKWEDPFKKPSYLFALVAGKLIKISDQYTTRSGRKVALEIFVEPGDQHKCQQALASLKRAMQWDEEHYGREYDLDVYMIVAVSDFNMGAMENKGLNIFNTKYVLVDQETATDNDFQDVERVIGHEYFHNWTGNRVTCRDWFQLSLKEGLTVFREQSFSESMGSSVVKRISDVKEMKTRQFAEDAGPMAHPVRPDSYIEINNFYTATVYNKGAEVIRMLHTLLGKVQFRKGMDCYFERHDGQAVTIEDFITAFEDANQIDLKQFYRWYQQAGTPEVHAIGEYLPKTHQFILTLKQNSPPFLMPVKIALYNQEGQSFPLKANKSIRKTEAGEFIVLEQPEEQFIFDDITAMPVPSLFGHFSAPVKWNYPYTTENLILLMKHDNDLFNRWDSAQRLSLQIIYDLMEAHRTKKTFIIPENYFMAFEYLLDRNIEDPALYAKLLSLPSFNYIAQTQPVIEVEAILNARKILLKEFTQTLKSALEKTYHFANEKDDHSLSSESMGYRLLKNICLQQLVSQGATESIELACRQYEKSKNMTDTIGSLTALNATDSPKREALFEDFYQRWKKDPLVVNKWLALHAVCEQSNTLDTLRALLHHEAFEIANPNKVYALINTFGASNSTIFHEKEGKGYDFVAQCVIELNMRNPQVASRVLEKLTSWRRLDEQHGQLMKNSLLKIQQAGNLSEDVYEILSKSLGV